MTRDTYFVARQTEDGLAIDGPLSTEELQQRITPNPEWEGQCRYGHVDGFATTVGEVERSHLDGKKLLIIRGEIAVPKAAEVVKKWSIG